MSESNPLSWLVETSVNDYIENLVQEAINLFLSFLAGMSSVSIQVLDMPVVVSATLYTQSIAGTILVVKIAYEAWMTMLLREDGNSNADPGRVLLNSAMAAAMIGGMPWLVREVFRWGMTVAADISTLPGTDFSNMEAPLQALFSSINAAASAPLFSAIGIIFAVVVLLVVFIQAFVKAAELSVTIVVGEFMAVGLTRNGSYLFSTWWKDLLSISLTPAIQMYMVKLSFNALTSFVFPAPLLNLTLFCAFLWVTYKSPSILKQYIHSSGIGQAGAGAAQTAIQMMLMRGGGAVGSAVPAAVPAMSIAAAAGPATSARMGTFRVKG